MFIVLSSCLLYPIMVIQSYRDRLKYTKNLNNVLNQNVNVTKPARFAFRIFFKKRESKRCKYHFLSPNDFL